MMRLKHPNIVRLYGVVNNTDPVLIVTELATGQKLIKYLQNNPMFLRWKSLGFTTQDGRGSHYGENKLLPGHLLWDGLSGEEKSEFDWLS